MAQGPFLAAVLLLISSGLHCSSPLPACPESCTCQTAPLLNCSSSGISLVPQNIQDSVTELDLSHNLFDSVTFDRPHHNLRNVWLGNNSITHLSLCIERNLGSRYVRGRHLHQLRPWRGRRCVSWAPNLQLLSVERNQLKQLPQGLEGSESLQVLQISFNRISALQPGDLSQLRQLKELHLQHNFITSLHPQMFQDLAQLRVLDLSFNMLTSLHPLMYLSLRNIGADVRLGGNRWQCDCSMLSLRRRLAYDSSRGLQAWSIVCASPSILSGRDLLQLEEDDLNCFGTEHGPELHRDVTVYSGSEILLSCSTQDSVWWTPSGQASLSQPQAGLLINDITERDTGLYVCVSEEHKVVSVFNLQISKIGGARRKTRSLPSTSLTNRIGQERNQRATQSDLALAVCLSVFITFLIAFILGVLARPCIDVLWERVTKKKSPSATNSVSSVEQRQYDNEAYSIGEEPELVGTHRERRVTFSTVDFREDSNVQYYDTIANQKRIKNDAVIGDSRGENSLRQTSPEDNQRDSRDLSGIVDAGRTHNIEFEHIPDPVEVEKRGSLSSCSDSSLSDKVLNEDQMTRGDHSTYKSHQLAEDSVQLRAESLTARKVEVPQFSKEGTSELPGFSSEPFADWSPHTNNNSLTDCDLGQENEEQFEFSDSVRSTSARSSSVCGSLNDSKLNVAPTSDKQKMDDTSSSSSYVSEDEPTQYTVNSVQEEKDIKRNHNKPEVTSACLKQNASFEQQIHNVDPIRPSVRFNQGDYRYDPQKPTVRPSHSSDSDGEDYTVKKGHVPSLAVTTHRKSLDTRAPSPPAAYSSSSSSEAETLSTDLDRQCIPQIQRRVDINAPLPVSDSSSSDESMDEKTKHTNKEEQGQVDMTGLQIKEYQSASHNSIKPQWPALDLGHATLIKRHLDIRALSPPTDSSSSDESADDTMDHMQYEGEMHVTRLPIRESQTGNHDADTQWPVLDLEHTTCIKRRLDIKAPSPPPDSSSSSDNEDETTNHIMKQEQGQMNMARIPSKVSQTGSYDPQTQWPVLDLEHTTRIKRRLDIKAPSPASGSSSSSDSENETTGHTERPGKVNVAGLPFQESQTGSYNPQTQWPALDLEHTTRIKRRLDIKAPSPESNSSSSSDSEDETTHHTERPGEVNIAGLPFQESQTKSYDPDTMWPALDLEHTTRIKRRLDIKAPSPLPDSSSSSDSDDESTNHIMKQEQGQMNMARIPSKVSQTGSYDTQTQWPVLDLERTTRIKRRLDIKAPSPESYSSSSSESDDETTHHTERPGKVNIAGLPFQESQTESYDPDTMWPAIDLEHTTCIKRRLDIKAPSPPPDSSSSSDNEDETTNHIMKQEQGQMNMARIPSKVSQTGSYDPQRQWPALDLEHTKRIKRRLDIKAPSPASGSSSSSDSEHETSGHKDKQRPAEVHIPELPFQTSQTVSHDPDTRLPSIDLEHIPCIKRHLDIKVPSLASDSSSSSDSEDETTNHMKQEQGQMNMARIPSKISQTGSYDPQTQWPVLDLERTRRIKRRLDIKAPSPESNSSSISNSEDETTHHTERPGKVNVAGLPFQESQTGSYNPQTQWPALDLEHTTRIKRRLDIKAPSPESNSSSSSDSEDETKHHTERPGKVNIVGLPFQESQTKSYDPDTMWPALDLEHTTRIKRRLDIKAPSPPPDSSSSSDNEDETTNHIMKQEQGQMNMARFPSKVSQTGSYDPQTQWPALDLEHTKRIKRRLDIKAPSPASGSSSSSDSEHETSGHKDKQKPAEVDIPELPFQTSQTVSHDPDTRLPSIDLEHIPCIKRRLDIKVPSLASDSSSSSDSEDETTNHMKQEQGQMNMARIPSKISQTGSYDPQTQWPVLDLERTTRIKRRLDIKAPSPESNSSSSSDSDDETTHHTERPGKVNVVGLPFQQSQTGSHDPDTKWPTLDLEHTTRIKRRLDIKAPSPPPHSPSSSDSEDETTKYTEKQKQGEISVPRLSSKVSQTVSYDPQTQWPVLDLERTTRIKRRLDIKAPSAGSGSSSSSYSEDETTHHIKKQEQGETHMARPPIKVSQTASYDPQTQWPALNLEHTKRIKRRLDIKAPSPPPDSSSSSDNEDGTTNHIMKQEQGQMNMARIPIKVSQTASNDPQTQWPALDLEHTMRIKRRLDIKAPSPESNSSSSSDSEDETTHHTERPGKVNIVGLPFLGNVGITSYQTGTKLPDMNVSVPPLKRRLNIKGPPLQPDPVLSSVSPGSRESDSNSFRSDSEDEYAKLGLGASAISKKTEKEFIRSPKTPVTKTDHNIKLEKYTVITDEVGDKTTIDKISTTPEINPELQSRWATMNLGISRFRKRLEITSHTHESPKVPSSLPPDSPSSSSSESGTRSKSSRTRQKRRGVGMQGIIQTESSLTPENKPVNVSVSLKGRDDNSVEVTEKFRKNYSLPTTEEKSNPDTMLTGFGTTTPPPPLRQMPDSSSSSENEDASTEHAGKGWRGRSKLPVVTDKEASQKYTSLYVAKAVDIKLDQSQSQTEEVQRKAGVEPHLSLTNIPHIRRALDIRAPLQRGSSSNSNSEDKSIDPSVPDLSLGVPRVKRRLNVKALPEHSNSPSSHSESENEATGYTANQSRHESNISGMTDNDDLITYKRLIIKTSSPPSNSFTPSGKSPFHSVGDRNASLAPKRVPSMSFDDVVKKRIEQPRHTANMDLPPEIRWTGVGRQSDLSIPSLSRHLDIGFSSPQQDRGKADVTLMHKHSSLSANNVSLASSRTLDKFDNPPRSTNEILRTVTENRNERKGLSALKAMSSERRRWDLLDENLNKGASPLFDDHAPQVDTSFNYRRSEKDIKPLAKQPPTQLHPSSTSVDERRATDLLYGIPRYRRHDFGGPPQEAPPPIPATPPPTYEAVGLTWRSPQSSMEQGLEGTRSYLQKSRNREI